MIFELIFFPYLFFFFWMNCSFKFLSMYFEIYKNNFQEERNRQKFKNKDNRTEQR